MYFCVCLHKVSEHPDCPQADVPMASSSLKDDEQVTNFLLLLLLQQEHSRVVWMLSEGVRHKSYSVG